MVLKCWGKLGLRQTKSDINLTLILDFESLRCKTPLTDQPNSIFYVSRYGADTSDICYSNTSRYVNNQCWQPHPVPSYFPVPFCATCVTICPLSVCLSTCPTVGSSHSSCRHPWTGDTYVALFMPFFLSSLFCMKLPVSRLANCSVYESLVALVT